MTIKELIEKIDGTTRGEIISQAYDLGFKDGYEAMSLVAMGETSSKMVVKNMLEDDNIRFLNKIANGEDTDSSDIKIDNKPNPPMPKDYGELKIVRHPKHIVVNGALYEKIDDSVLTIANGYGDMV